MIKGAYNYYLWFRVVARSLVFITHDIFQCINCACIFNFNNVKHFPAMRSFKRAIWDCALLPPM